MNAAGAKVDSEMHVPSKQARRAVCFRRLSYLILGACRVVLRTLGHESITVVTLSARSIKSSSKPLHTPLESLNLARRGMTANVELTLNPTIALADAGAASPTTTASVSSMENGYYRAKPTPGPRLAAVGCGVLALVSAAAVGGVFVGRATKDDGEGSGSMPPAEHKSGITAPSCRIIPSNSVALSPRDEFVKEYRCARLTA